MTEPLLKTEIDARGVGTVTLNRPEVHNAFNAELIAELTSAFVAMGSDPLVRIVVMASTGKSFSAGADLNWMQAAAASSEAENKADALRLAQMLRTIDRCPKPVIAKVQGQAFGGGVGLISACDMVVASEDAAFSLSEVKLGIIPSVISPYVVAAMGARQARRFLITGERFMAETARRIGLVHKIVPAAELDEEVKRLIQTLLKNGPAAMSETKNLIFAVDRPLDDAVVEDTASRITRIRASAEGREGMGAFLEKRKPNWIKE